MKGRGRQGLPALDGAQIGIADENVNLASLGVPPNTPLWPAGCGPRLGSRAFVFRKAHFGAFRALRAPVLTSSGGEITKITTHSSGTEVTEETVA